MATQLLTLKEAADLCKVKPFTLRQLAFEGKIRGVKIGRPWRFIEEDLIEDIKLLAQQNKKWDQSTDETIALSGGSLTPTQIRREYEKVLKQKKEPSQNKS